jgi:hypothetical protein
MVDKPSEFVYATRFTGICYDSLLFLRNNVSSYPAL